MAGFNTMPALSSAAPPGPAAAHNARGMTATAAMDPFNNGMMFDESMLDPVSMHSLLTPSGYDFDAFSTTFEDPFSFPPRPFESASAAAAALDPDAALYGSADVTSPHELDNKLLGFGAVIPSGKATLLTDSGQIAEPHMTGELYGMFFVAEDVFCADSGTPAGRPLELTCYRRNLWQISGQITLPRHVAHVVDDHGRRAPIAGLAASITAVESIEGRAAEMITIPWRGASAAHHQGPQPLVDEARVVTSAPPLHPLDFAGTGSHEVDNGNRVSVPVSWKRLQFKHATANNGRRKGLQQHYVVQINLLVRPQGAADYLKVAEVQSGPVIVRGRSPRNFDSRREVPLGDRRPLERRSTSTNPASATPSATACGSGSGSGSGGGSGRQRGGGGGAEAGGRPKQDDAGEMAREHHGVGSFGSQQTPTSSLTPDWATPYASNNGSQGGHVSKKLAITSPSGLSRPPVPAWASLDSGNGNGNGNGNGGSGSGGGQKHAGHKIHPLTNTTATTTPTKSCNAKNAGTAFAGPQPLPISLSEDERSPPASSNQAGSLDTGGGGLQSWSSSAGPGSGSGPGSSGWLGAPGGGNSSSNNNNNNSSAGGFLSRNGGGGGGGSSSSSLSPPLGEFGLSQHHPQHQPEHQQPGQNPLASPMETEEDMLYEYFPLSLDDWMPPVDAIYRPHVVHHTIVPPEVKAQQVRSKAKRYFAAD
ncbi:hypothetical protein VTJ83DRAFT_5498 [Remersonia thermophila]|uniref:NDT80 domain-containing protein n=1 Tax=Remersonia thermophila TaxID=72144 RepID=A0ABR4D737_9PEZI